VMWAGATTHDEGIGDAEREEIGSDCALTSGAQNLRSIDLKSITSLGGDEEKPFDQGSWQEKSPSGIRITQLQGGQNQTKKPKHTHNEERRVPRETGKRLKVGN